MAYPIRGGHESERLQLIWDIYSWCGSQQSGSLYCKNGGLGQTCNKNREHPIAWDLAQVFAAIAGGYVIELSPHYKGIQLIKKNKALWEQVSKFVKIKVGSGCLPYDGGLVGERWEILNGVSFFSNV